jgi:hypothetical protein
MALPIEGDTGFCNRAIHTRGTNAFPRRDHARSAECACAPGDWVGPEYQSFVVNGSARRATLRNVDRAVDFLRELLHPKDSAMDNKPAPLRFTQETAESDPPVAISSHPWPMRRVYTCRNHTRAWSLLWMTF